MGMVMVGNQKYQGVPCGTPEECRQSAAASALSELRLQVGGRESGRGRGGRTRFETMWFN